MFLADGSEGATYAADTDTVKSSVAIAAPAAGGGAAGGATADDDTTVLVAHGASSAAPGAKIDLWDRNFPSGRYYWTVVPVRVVITQKGIEYRETELPQDTCQGQAATSTQPAIAPRMLSFGKHGAEPQPTRGKAVPYATGLSPSGKLVSASPGKVAFYGSPLVAWTAAPSANTYVVEWSKTAYPWRPAGHVKTPATSAVLPLEPGTWFYRVRGVNDSIPGNPNMQWSGSAKIQIARPTFAVVTK
jgi:hypothetical protein